MRASDGPVDFDPGPTLAGDLDHDLEIGYVDAAGAASRRRITLHAIHGSADRVPDYLVGFCQLRRDIRHFRIDRIREIVDPETGEVFDDAERLAREIVASVSGRPFDWRPNEWQPVPLPAPIPATIVLRRFQDADVSQFEDREYQAEISAIQPFGQSCILIGHASSRTSNGRRWSGMKRFYPAAIVAITANGVRHEADAADTFARGLLAQAPDIAPITRHIRRASAEEIRARVWRRVDKEIGAALEREARRPAATRRAARTRPPRQSRPKESPAVQILSGVALAILGILISLLFAAGRHH